MPLTLTTNGASTPTTTGAVMWYHDLNSNAPNNVAPFQLTEFSFRGPFYNKAVNVGTGFDWLLDGNDTHSPTGIYAGSISILADYDISFVDTIDLPVAMEATDVTIPGTTAQAPFGWVGSSQTVKNFQQALQQFTSTNQPGTNTNFLGQYFDGKGYPSYNVIQQGNTKLPSAQNVFFSSPLVKGVSSIQFYMKFSDGSIIKAPMYALSSGGTGPSQIGIGGSSQFINTEGSTIGLATFKNEANQYALSNLIGKNLAPGPDQQQWTVFDNNKMLDLGTVASIVYQDVEGTRDPGRGHPARQAPGRRVGPGFVRLHSRGFRLRGHADRESLVLVGEILRRQRDVDAAIRPRRHDPQRQHPDSDRSSRRDDAGARDERDRHQCPGGLHRPLRLSRQQDDRAEWGRQPGSQRELQLLQT